jgi:hypothetical protein
MPRAGLARQISNPDVSVGYSGAGVSADEVLQRAICADSAARLLLVVSSDHEIAKAARRRRAKSVRSDEFWARVLRDIARPVKPSLEPEAKQGGLQPDEVDRWLRELELDDGHV